MNISYEELVRNWVKPLLNSWPELCWSGISQPVWKSCSNWSDRKLPTNKALRKL